MEDDNGNSSRLATVLPTIPEIIAAVKLMDRRGIDYDAALVIVRS